MLCASTLNIPSQMLVQEIEVLGRRYGLTVIERSPDGFSLLLRVITPAELLARDEQVAPYSRSDLNPVPFK